jgi:uncharacterized protein YbjT (DUF2867 family)
MLLITGGTGFVGRRVAARLVAQGESVRALARRGADLPGVEMQVGDVRDVASVVSAARGCQAVIHLVGIIRERRGATFRRVHVEGTRSVIRACQEAGVTRLLHMSALGARPNARASYHRTKWEAEEVVRASGLAATIFRPSVIFGAGGEFLPTIRRLVRSRSPILPILGPGTSLLQPIWIEDVVTCFVKTLDLPETAGHSYNLGGPEAIGFEELVDLVAADEGVEKRKFHLPVLLARPAIAVLSRLVPGFPITSEQLTMLLEDSVCDITEMTRVFGVASARLGEHLRD